ncbi:MAG: substrate-binding domain-containing protein [Phycisphaerales bacterium]|nr:substrate-binding domain-containing protein [Phycisphaerales bacterium]
MIQSNNKLYAFVLIFVSLLLSCYNQQSTEQQESPKNGRIVICCDESFRPVIQQEQQLYQITYPNAHLDIAYEPQIKCFEDLYKDSVRMIIVDRGLTDSELAYYKSSLSFKPIYDSVAWSAIAVIVNKQSADTLFSYKSLKKLLTQPSSKEIVLDGVHTTSVIDYLQSNILHGQPLGNHIRGCTSTSAVIATVANNKNAIGFIGYCWLNNFVDSLQYFNLNKIKVAKIESPTMIDTFVAPSPATIYFKQYPLTYPIYYILKENFTGLGSGFANFMSLERGQLIFQNALLVPIKMNFTVRKVLQ